MVAISGIPKGELVLPASESEKEKSTVSQKSSISQKSEKSTKPKFTASVTTAKTTLGHSATVTARDEVYKVVKYKYYKEWR